MRVLLDTTFARRAPYSGTGIYLDRLVDALSKLDGIEAVAAYNPRRRAPAGGGLGSVRNALADLWWTEAELPRLAPICGARGIHHPPPAPSRRAAGPPVGTLPR